MATLTTPIKKIPYPALTEIPDIPRDIQALALNLENVVRFNRGTLAAMGSYTLMSEGDEWLATDDTSHGPNGTWYVWTNNAWRRLYPDFGITAGTVVQGNDPRMPTVFKATPSGPVWTTPGDGQVIRMLTSQPHTWWSFQYNATATVWEWIGGSPWYRHASPQATTTGTTYAGDISSALIAPYSGTYFVRAGCQGFVNTGGTSGEIAIGDTDAHSALSTNTGRIQTDAGTEVGTLYVEDIITVSFDGQDIGILWRNLSAGASFTIMHRWVELFPMSIRVG
jgi:hypothetical protein